MLPTGASVYLILIIKTRDSEGKCDDEEIDVAADAKYAYTAPVFAAIRQDIHLAAELKAIKAEQAEKLINGAQDENNVNEKSDGKDIMMDQEIDTEMKVDFRSCSYLHVASKDDHVHRIVGDCWG